MSKVNARKTALGIPSDVPKTAPSSANARKALEWMDSLILLGGVFDNEAGKAFRRVLRWLSSKEEEDPARGFRRWGLLWKTVVNFEEFTAYPRTGTLLQDYWLEQLLENDNTFHRKAESSPLSGLSPSLYQTYVRELDLFLQILKIDWEGEFLKKSGLLGRAEAPSLEGIKESKKAKDLSKPLAARVALKDQLLRGTEPIRAKVETVAKHFHENGWGLFGRYRAFRWEDRGQGGNLVGLESLGPDPLEPTGRLWGATSALDR